MSSVALLGSSGRVEKQRICIFPAHRVVKARSFPDGIDVWVGGPQLRVNLHSTPGAQLKAAVPGELVPRLDSTGDNSHVGVRGVLVFELYTADRPLLVQDVALRGGVKVNLRNESQISNRDLLVVQLGGIFFCGRKAAFIIIITNINYMIIADIDLCSLVFITVAIILHHRKLQRQNIYGTKKHNRLPRHILHKWCHHHPQPRSCMDITPSTHIRSSRLSPQHTSLERQSSYKSPQ